MSTLQREVKPGHRRIRFLVWGGVALLMMGVIISLRFSKTAPFLPEVKRDALTLADGRLYWKNQTNLFTGILFEQYEGGALKSRSVISNGVLHGLSQGWFTNGVLEVNEPFKNGLSHGTRQKWYSTGTNLSQAAIGEGKLEGPFQRWHENGQLAEQIPMKAGQPDGVALSYYPSGFLKAEVRLQNGQVVEQKTWKDGVVKKGSSDQ